MTSAVQAGAIAPPACIERRDRPIETAVPLHRGSRCWIRLVLLACALALSGCSTWVITPPPEPDDPKPAFLLDHGRHASLVLPRERGIVRYSYGQWDWYVLNRKGPYRASGILFTRSQAGIGRRDLPGPARLSSVREQVAVPIEEAWRIEVDAARAAELDRELRDLFAAQPEAVVDNPLVDLEFVPHPTPYSLGHNSNHTVAEWLRDLGATVEGGGPHSRWQVTEPEAGR